MGNWSCLYHWMEFQTKSDALAVYKRLEHTEEFFKDFDAAATDSWAVRFGFLNDMTLQLVSSQKWGLSHELSWWACEAVPDRPVTIVQSGIDSREHYSVHGSPRTVLPVYDRLCFIDWQPGREFENAAGRSPHLFELEDSIQFGLAHFNDSDLAGIGSGAACIRRIVEEFKTQRSEDEKRVAFGRTTPTGVLFFGDLYLESDGFVFETTGCYNRLHEIRQLGPYQTPLDDEPEPLLLPES